jgi:hypothetical protein
MLEYVGPNDGLAGMNWTVEIKGGQSLAIGIAARRNGSETNQRATD